MVTKYGSRRDVLRPGTGKPQKTVKRSLCDRECKTSVILNLTPNESEW